MSDIIYYNSKNDDVITIENLRSPHNDALDINKIIDVSAEEKPSNHALRQACEALRSSCSNAGWNNIHIDRLDNIISIIES